MRLLHTGIFTLAFALCAVPTLAQQIDPAGVGVSAAQGTVSGATDTQKRDPIASGTTGAGQGAATGALRGAVGGAIVGGPPGAAAGATAGAAQGAAEGGVAGTARGVMSQGAPAAQD